MYDSRAPLRVGIRRARRLRPHVSTPDREEPPSHEGCPATLPGGAVFDLLGLVGGR